jgi:hypothetical protein
MLDLVGRRWQRLNLSIQGHPAPRPDLPVSVPID